MSKNKGYFEFFNLDALDEIPKLLDLYNLKSEKLKRSLFNERFDILVREKINSKKFKNSINKRIDVITETLNSFNSIKRILYLMRLKCITCIMNENEMTIESPVLLMVKNKRICLCGVNIFSLSSRSSVSIDINSIINVLNEHASAFIRNSGFDLCFFTLYLLIATIS